ncbi:MAG: LamG domain-containing protein [Patescibacteria group bacterium]|nr:LamG domain-containing protein [Patescibacteria group bacterium]
MYYGNTSAIDGQNKTAVWNSNYVLVQHLGETSGTTTFDSTANANNGTKVSATDPNPSSLGQIDGAQSFNGVNDFIKIDNNANIDNITVITVSAWVKTNNTTSQAIWTSYGAPHGYQLWLQAGQVAMWSDSGTVNSGVFVADGQWHYIVGVFDGTNVYIYVDGTQRASGAGTVTANTGNNQIGNQCVGAGYTSCSLYMNGLIDELHISNTVRSAAWIAASYKSETDNFNTFGAEELRPNSPPNTPINSSPTNGATLQLLTPTLTASAFSDPDASDTNAASNWQVDDNSNFLFPEWTRTSTSGETSTTVNAANGVFANSLAGKSELAHNTVYYWRVRYQDSSGALNSWSSYSTSTTFTTNLIHTPTNSSPANGITITTLTPTLSASAFSDDEPGHTQSASEWQIDNDINFASPEYDSGATSSLTSLTVPSGALLNGSHYFQVRYQDSGGQWSSYSAPTSFYIDTDTGEYLLQPVGWNQTYNLGDTARFTLQVLARDANGGFDPVTPDSIPIWRLRYWDGATWQELVSATSMTPLAASSTYEATYVIPSDAAWTGREVTPMFYATVNDVPTSLTREIEIVSSPAQVVINNITNNTVPNITANITITNEGTAAFEYTYDYCVVVSIIDQCGGAGNIAYSSAAKLIQPSQNFITNLTLNVPNPGNYFFKTSVWWSNKSSNASRSFTAAAAATSSPSSNSSSVGGGGGGGGTVWSGNLTASSSSQVTNSAGSTNSSFVAVWEAIYTFSQRLNRLENRVDVLESKIKKLENINQSNYSSVYQPQPSYVPSSQPTLPKINHIFRIRLN